MMIKRKTTRNMKLLNSHFMIGKKGRIIVVGMILIMWIFLRTFFLLYLLEKKNGNLNDCN